MGTRNSSRGAGRTVTVDAAIPPAVSPRSESMVASMAMDVRCARCKVRSGPVCCGSTRPATGDNAAAIRLQAIESVALIPSSSRRLPLTIGLQHGNLLEHCLCIPTVVPGAAVVGLSTGLATQCSQMERSITLRRSPGRLQPCLPLKWLGQLRPAFSCLRQIRRSTAAPRPPASSVLLSQLVYAALAAVRVCAGPCGRLLADRLSAL